jgi:hypothetical protein
MAVRKVSEFPVVEANNVYVFGRSSNNKNVQTILDIKQELGDSTISVVSQKAITEAINSVKAKTGENITIGRSLKYGNNVITSDTSITDVLEDISEKINDLVLNEIPDGSITENKLAEVVTNKINHDNGYWFEIITDNNNSTQVFYYNRG